MAHPRCFICDNPGTEQIYAIVYVCQPHKEGRGQVPSERPDPLD